MGKALRIKDGFTLIREDYPGDNYKLIDLVGIYSKTNWHAVTRTMCIILAQHHYCPISKVLPKLTTDNIKQVIDLSFTDPMQFTCLVYLFAVAEGETELTQVNDNIRYHSQNLRNLLFICQYLNLNGVEHNGNAYSLFDQNKKLYKEVTLAEFIRVFESSDHAEFDKFVKSLKDDDNKTKESIK